MKLEKVKPVEYDDEKEMPTVHLDCSNNVAAQANVGDEVTIVIKGTVSSVRQSDSDWGSPGSICVRYDRMGIDSAPSEEEVAVNDLLGSDY